MSAPVVVEREHGLALLRQMLLVRRFEEKCVELYSAKDPRVHCTSTSARRRWQSGPWRR